MGESSQGIPNLPDLTHPNELMGFGMAAVRVSVILAVLVIALGVILLLLRWSDRGSNELAPTSVQLWLRRYLGLVNGFTHLVLLLVLLVGGFFLCSTLANRYHYWEQTRIAQVAATVAGDRLEQTAPQMRYLVEEPYVYTTFVDGNLVRVEETQQVPRFLPLAGSQIEVTIDQSTDVQNLSAVYQTDFQASYGVVNTLTDVTDFLFEISPPYGYSLLQGFRVEQNGDRLLPASEGQYSFPVQLAPGAETQFQVTYQAQGGPRWIYSAGGQLLSNFRLTALANFPRADFASGIAPTTSEAVGTGTRFTWQFDDNVSVRNPFGVFTATAPISNTGILPRLLLLAPALFLWWILLLYLSVPLTLQDVAIAAGVFFASLLALTYFSRLMDVRLAWAMLSLVFLGLSWGLGRHHQARLAALICTIAGGVLPVWGMLIPYSGLTLSLAGLLSVVWLTVRLWYHQPLEPRTTTSPPV